MHSIVIIYTDLSGKEPYRQVSVDRVIASGYLDSVTVCTYRQVSVDRVIASGYLDSVTVCTGLPGKEPYRQVCVDRVIASGSLG